MTSIMIMAKKETSLQKTDSTVVSLCTVQYKKQTVQKTDSTVQYSTVQYSTVQYSTVVAEVSSFIGKPVYPSLGAFAP